MCGFLWRTLLFAHCESKEQGTRNVVAECLGKLTLIDPTEILPALQVIKLLVNLNLFHELVYSWIWNQLRWSSVISLRWQVVPSKVNCHICGLCFRPKCRFKSVMHWEDVLSQNRIGHSVRYGEKLSSLNVGLLEASSRGPLWLCIIQGWRKFHPIVDLNVKYHRAREVPSCVTALRGRVTSIFPRLTYPLTHWPPIDCLVGRYRILSNGTGCARNRDL